MSTSLPITLMLSLRALFVTRSFTTVATAPAFAGEKASLAGSKISMFRESSAVFMNLFQMIEPNDRDKRLCAAVTVYYII